MQNETAYWTFEDDVYTSTQIKAVLNYLRIEIISETYTDFLCYCAFHYNRDTPAFCVSKTSGLYYCQNPSCQKRGRLVDLICELKAKTEFEAKRLILKKGSETKGSYAEQFAEATKPPKQFPEWPQEKIDELAGAFWNHQPAIDYMLGRHFTEETLKRFEVGWSAKMGMVTYPVHDNNGRCLGVVGRSIEGKEFKNSTDLPKSHTLFNLHRAKYFDTVVVVEAGFDAMRGCQATADNFVAIMGGHLSPDQIYYLNRHWSTVIIMTDNDPVNYYQGCAKCKKFRRDCVGHSPGRDLGAEISGACVNKRILWASYEPGLIFPTNPLEGYRDKAAKDNGNMTDQEISQCVRNAMSDFDYQDFIAARPQSVV